MLSLKTTLHLGALYQNKESGLRIGSVIRHLQYKFGSVYLRVVDVTLQAWHSRRQTPEDPVASPVPV